MSTEAPRGRDLLAQVELHRSRFEHAPGGGLSGCAHRFLRMRWSALPTSDARACVAMAGSASTHRELVAGWLHVVPTGGYILPCQPAREWGPPEQPSARMEELVLAVDVADGATLHFGGAPHRDPEHEGRRITVHGDAWYWVSPVVGRDRISLVWWVR